MGKLVKKTQMTTGGPVFVYVDEEKDKIVRITPMDLDDDDNSSKKDISLYRMMRENRRHRRSAGLQRDVSRIREAGFPDSVRVIW